MIAQKLSDIKMIQPTKLYSISVLTVACLALTACSASPSESDLRSAIENKMKTDSEAMELTIGKQGMPIRPEIKNVHKNGCKPASENAYRCDVEIEIMQRGTIAKGSASMLFLKNSNGWVATK